MLEKEIVPEFVGRRGDPVTKNVNCALEPGEREAMVTKKVNYARVPEKIGVTVTNNQYLCPYSPKILEPRSQKGVI
ncbi:hypothetical protein [Neobacillus vireti]|uniref:hypothetical protein n=1 Tax=Neobacillus vireti TaxID=220686 RepID=UPI0030003172